MNLPVTKNLAGRVSPRILAAVVAVLGLGLVAAVLVPGFELATELGDTTAALDFLGAQQRYPETIRSTLEAARDRLITRSYVQAPLDRLRDAVSNFDAAQKAMDHATAGGWLASTNGTAAFAEGGSAGHVAALRSLWSPQREVLAPVIGFNGVPYQDSEATGTVLNDAGRRLMRDVNAAIRATHRLMPPISAQLAALTTDLQARSAHTATRLRIIMLAGLLVAGVLVVMVTMLLAARRRQADHLRDARRQTEDILRTVREGLFLLDERLVIGPTYSTALEKLFQRQDFAGLPFADLLRGVVADKTLEIAVKFVGILWSERTNENLVKSINPLGEVEVNIANAQGHFETHYLEFEFHRVRMDGRITQVLVSVSDITARVALARELSASQSQAQAQVDTLLGILHVDPAQLSSFLGDSNAAMKMINTVLREPARDEPAFRRKLDTLFRQAHSVKGEAASLGLSSIESRAHAFEDDLRALREKAELSGNDFLPLVIKLDDLLTHLQSISELVSRLSRLHVGGDDLSHTDTSVIEEDGTGPLIEDSDLVSLLRKLGARVARENGKEAEVLCVGFDLVPENFRRLIKDVAIQAVRNSITHGIETAAVRAALGKSAKGTIRIEFQEVPEAGYRLTIEDDGAGLSPERIKTAAIQKGFLTAEQAARLDPRQTFALLFQSGFSTAETVTKDAGRGVGMNLMADLVHEIGGRVAVATKLGKFTRLSLSLPPSAGQAGSFEAA